MPLNRDCTVLHIFILDVRRLTIFFFLTKNPDAYFWLRNDYWNKGHFKIIDEFLYHNYCVCHSLCLVLIFAKTLTTMWVIGEVTQFYYLLYLIFYFFLKKKCLDASRQYIMSLVALRSLFFYLPSMCPPVLSEEMVIMIMDQLCITTA